MWQTLMDGGLDMLFMFVLSYLTYDTLDAIVVFHERDVWPCKPPSRGLRMYTIPVISWVFLGFQPCTTQRWLHVIGQRVVG